MRKAFLVSCAVVAGIAPVLLLAFFITGYTISSERVVLLSMSLNQAPEAIYAVLTDYEELPAWLDQVKAVEIRREQEGTTVWTAAFSSGERVSVFASEIQPPSDLKWRFSSENRHVTAYWDFVLTPENGGTDFSLNVTGIALHPLYRLTSKSLIDDETLLRQFCEALARKFGEAPAIIQHHKE